MLRYLAGAASALLLVAAGFVIWTSRAGADDPVPPAPSAQPLFAPLSQPPSAPPAADKTAEQKRFGRLCRGVDEDCAGLREDLR